MAYSRSSGNVEMPGNFTGYEIYINYKKVLDALENNELRSDQIIKLTDISMSSLHHILADLMKNNVIKIIRYDINRGGKSRVFVKIKK